ncbi:hypothetical protein Q5752_001524 [Cryptotrichosporon argae]
MSRVGPEPRVNGRTIAEHDGKTVRLVCEVVKVTGDTAVVKTSDGQEIGVFLSRDMHIEDPFVEIIGLVKDRTNLKALTSINLGKKLDMKAVDAVVEFGHSSKGQGILA